MHNHPQCIAMQVWREREEKPVSEKEQDKNTEQWSKKWWAGRRVKVRGKVRSRWFETRWVQTHLQLSGLMSKQFASSPSLSCYTLFSSLFAFAIFPPSLPRALPLNCPSLGYLTLPQLGNLPRSYFPLPLFCPNLHLRRLHLPLFFFSPSPPSLNYPAWTPVNEDY